MIGLAMEAVAEHLANMPQLPYFRVEIPAGSPFMGPSQLEFMQGMGELKVERAESLDHNEVESEGTKLFERLILTLQHRVERYPNSARAHANLGLALLNADRLSEAATEFGLALQLEPDQYVAAINMARIEARREDYETAFVRLMALRQSYPESTGPIMALADLAARQGRRDEAIEIWRLAVALTPDAAMPRYYLAMAILGSGEVTDARDAIAHLRIASRAEVRNPAIYHGLGVAYVFAKDYRRATRAFKSALALAPWMGEATHGLAWILLEQGQSDQAIALLTKDIDERDYEALELLAWAYHQRHELRATRKHLLLALEALRLAGGDQLLRQSRLLNNLGVCYAELGSLDEAEARFQSALRAQPGDDATALHNLARLYLQQRRFDEARTLLESHERRFPEDRETWMLLAAALHGQKRYDASLSKLRRVMHTGEAPALAYAMMGYLLTEAKQDLSASIAVLSEGHGRFPEDATIANNLAYAYLERGHTEEARAILASPAISGGPDSETAVIHATRGLLALRDGDFSSAIAGYDRAAQIATERGDKNLARAARQKKHLTLARAYLSTGENEVARREVRRGLRIGGGSDFHRRDLEHLDKLWNSPGGGFDC